MTSESVDVVNNHGINSKHQNGWGCEQRKVFKNLYEKSFPKKHSDLYMSGSLHIIIEGIKQTIICSDRSLSFENELHSIVH